MKMVLIALIVGTFAASPAEATLYNFSITIAHLDPINTLFADNIFYTSGLHVDDDGWTWRAGAQDYNMFLSEGIDSHGNPTENLLIGFPGISGGSKKVTFTATAVAPVPEPATLGLFGMGMIGLGLMRRRKAA
jgi:hypothetical protein